LLGTNNIAFHLRSSIKKSFQLHEVRFS